MVMILVDSQELCERLQDWGLQYCQCKSDQEENVHDVSLMEKISSSGNSISIFITSDLSSRKLQTPSQKSMKKQCRLCGKGENPHDPIA
jgi:hypothetical protein